MVTLRLSPKTGGWKKRILLSPGLRRARVLRIAAACLFTATVSSENESVVVPVFLIITEESLWEPGTSSMVLSSWTGKKNPAMNRPRKRKAAITIIEERAFMEYYCV